MTENIYEDCIPCREFTKDRKTAVAMGIFDGVHRGHKEVIKTAVGFRKKGLFPAVFTFKTNTVTSKGDGLETILSDELKYEKISELGADLIFSPPFSAYKDYSPERFVREVLVENLSASVVVCGEDFRFGKNASGNCETLRELGKTYGFETIVIKPVSLDNKVVSSTSVRELLKQGNVSRANTLLGSAFSMRLEVVHGAELARTWNFPTINQIIPKGQVVPKFGVYCSKIMIDGRWYNGVTNIGVKPTVNIKTEPLAETFIMDYDGDLYGQKLTLCLYEFIRAEKKFGSLDELKEEIAKNKNFAEKYFEKLT